ncbi:MULTISPECIES: hypothetical protein [Mammaliicoccus]|uniref:hypothetical protein n=1 Tax=Mammaliicoccus TaxID=2803850 RepID=UPI000E017A4F|nr:MULTISPECIES: hypothetical protein [Mammaliicoccus]MEB7779548.1 hypothetical protein [Mammaliicoccus fleurettii]SUM36449.1 Uncharacterised protein [Mammaliicoccus fleurettii]
MIQWYNINKNESGVFDLQIITFILVVLPLLFIISIFQRKKRAIVKKDYGIIMALGVIGVFLSSILLTLTNSESSLSFSVILGSIGAGIVWGILVSLTLFLLKKLLNK